MDGTRANQELDALRQRLERLTVTSDKLTAALAQKLIRRTSDDETVTATANGLGELVDLRIDESATRYPHQLGAHITAAVTRARSAGTALSEKASEKYLPGLPSARDLTAELAVPDDPVDYNAIDYAGAARLRNTIAEGIEMLQKVQRAEESAETTRLRKEIGVAAGIVVINPAGTFLEVSITPEAVRQIGVQRLAGQVLQAIRAAEAQAQATRQTVLNELPISE
ncbi:MAG: YbaB/EbfC family nucleoid-associated protein [Actinomadura sp.]